MELFPTLLSVCLAAVFASLGVVHLLWAAGASWGKGAATPTRLGKPVLETGSVACLGVAALLFLAAALCLGRIQLVDLGPAWISTVGVWGLAIVFLLRAVGDFRYVGFFKKVRGTRFAYLDTVLYSPLCLGISALAIGLSITAP